MRNPLNIVKNVFVRNSVDAVQNATHIKNPRVDRDAKDLADLHPYAVKKTIRNCRYAYNTDGLVQGLILNNTFKANNKWVITFDDNTIGNIEDAKKFIEDKCKEWNLDTRMSEWLIKEQRDGKHFTQKIYADGTIKLEELAYDGELYDFEIIRDLKTGEILGYKQKYWTTGDVKDWKSQDFDSIHNIPKHQEEANFEPDEIIYGTLFEEDGEGMSLIMPILDDIADKWSFEQYKKSVAHKTGNVAVMTVGNKEVFTDNTDESFLNTALDNLENREQHDTIIIPYGTSIETLGGNYNLPDLNTYIDKTLSNIYIQLQTPQTLFASDSSNRSTIEVQTDEETGFAVYLEYMRDNLRNTVDELIDDELSLHDEFKDCVGHIHLTFLSIKQERLLRKEYVDEETMIRYDLADDDVDSSQFDDGSSSDDDRLPADNKGVPNDHGSPKSDDDDGFTLTKDDDNTSNKSNDPNNVNNTKKDYNKSKSNNKSKSKSGSKRNRRRNNKSRSRKNSKDELNKGGG